MSEFIVNIILSSSFILKKYNDVKIELMQLFEYLNKNKKQQNILILHSKYNKFIENCYIKMILLNLNKVIISLKIYKNGSIKMYNIENKEIILYVSEFIENIIIKNNLFLFSKYILNCSSITIKSLCFSCSWKCDIIKKLLTFNYEQICLITNKLNITNEFKLNIHGNKKNSVRFKQLAAQIKINDKYYYILLNCNGNARIVSIKSENKEKLLILCKNIRVKLFNILTKILTICAQNILPPIIIPVNIPLSNFNCKLKPLKFNNSLYNLLNDLLPPIKSLDY